MSSQPKNYHTTSPVLFIIFNRTDTSLRVLEAIKNAKPTRLYLAADGPRTSRLGEDLKCIDTKAQVLAAIDWQCEIKTLFREDNVGPKEFVSSAINWLFEHEEQGIILEHDCLPSNSFFMFCDQLLDKYRDDTRIWLISGPNYLSKDRKFGDASYYFSNLTNTWGWATWRRSWKLYNKDLTQFEVDEIRPQLEKIFNNKMIVDNWVELFVLTKANKIDTWDYQVAFSHMFNHSLNIIPNYNLVSNIGFGELAENTLNADSVFANVPLDELTEIIHPKYMLPENEADQIFLFEEFMIPHKLAELKRYNKPKRRLKRWLKSLVS
jgi:hypothetical protein